MKEKLKLTIRMQLLLLAASLFTIGLYGSNVCILVEKRNVIHKFIPADVDTDQWVLHSFPGWEEETFDVFEQVKNSEEIAIDLGAWIGTTSIWLSNNFHHVVAVDADRESLKCLKQNIAASGCTNVSICERPVYATSENIIFGPPGELNKSVSFIKKQSSNQYDCHIQGITIKQLIHDYVYADEKLKSRKISFIKCDIEGGEENILEDLLHFAYYNKTKVFVSFHLSWWKSKKIEEFEYLFKFFKTSCPNQDVCGFVTHHPFESILFEPIEDAGILRKKNLPAIVVCNNAFTHVKSMIKQLEAYTSDIILIDNNSDYQPLLDYYEQDFHYTLLRQKVNLGPEAYLEKFAQNLVGDLYLLANPGLEFNFLMPRNTMQTLDDLSHYFQASRVGFALCMDSHDIRTDITHNGHTIKDWERRFWQSKISYPPDPSLELYLAPVEDTFCLVNKRYDPQVQIRIAGDFTSIHLPWHQNFQANFHEGEYEAYMKNNNSALFK